MIRHILAFIILMAVFSPVWVSGQGNSQDIYSDYVLFQKRARLDHDLRENIVARSFHEKLDSNNEHKFESACLAVSQFLFDGPVIKSGFDQLFNEYNWLQTDTRRAFLEAVYAVYPNDYSDNIRSLFINESDPLLFAMAAAYLLRNDGTTEKRNDLKITMVEKFPGYDSIYVLAELERYINNFHTGNRNHKKSPDLRLLFEHQKMVGRKIVYSLQRWNRDYPGMAIIQHANGRFARDANGRLLVFQQLARSASDLPYFITNGSTPQGIFSLQGTAVSRINWIGPTPNLQMVMPFESSWDKYFHQPLVPDQDSLLMYKQLLPPSWRNYLPMMETWYAGKTGRSEIIAHGTTIDPEYYAGKPFYPLTPTMGCLCAREQWNVTTGKLLLSEQYGLASAYSSSPGRNGYLYVVNLDDQQKAVTREEVEHWVRTFER
ncbi:MAG: hypothetical protein EOO04_16415 [Chitinophagaceae bacterium]|nr:MAG: hypothetical protein EOO04_16415 [Chitinophagaceae bacterium]